MPRFPHKRSDLMTGIAAAVMLTAGALMALPAHAQPVIGEPAPNFSVVDSDGMVRSLSDFEGKRVILEWTNEGCPFVKKHYDSERANMQTLQSELGGEDDTVWLTVRSSAPGKQGHMTADEAKAHAASVGARPTHILLDPDGTMGRTYDAKTTPHMFIIDADAEQTLVYDGAIDSLSGTNPAEIDTAENYVRKASGQLDAGEAVTPAKTKPYGCSVKYAS